MQLPKPGLLSSLIGAKRTFDWYLTFIVVTLLLIGLAYLASALTATSGVEFSAEFGKQFVFILIGCGVCYGLSRVDYHRLVALHKPLVIAVLVLLTIIFIPVVYTLISAAITGASLPLLQSTVADQLHFVHYANNSIRWLQIGPLQLQPSELAKLVLLLYIAAVIKKQSVTWDTIKRPLYIIGYILLTIVLQPDLGNAIVLSIILMTALWVAGVKLQYFAIVAIIGVLLSAYFVFGVSFRSKRIQTWAYQNYCSQYDLKDLKNNIPRKEDRVGICKYFDFQIDKEADFYQTQNIRTAMASGGWFGVGYNQGEIKNLIPEKTNDGIIGVIGEESGFLMVSLILILYLLLFLRGISIAEHAPDLEGRIIAAGISVWILLQAFWNLTGMTGLIPMKGLPLPFISEGGSAIMSNLLALGVLLNISSQTKQAPAHAVSSKNTAKKKKIDRTKRFAYR
jgi:cell division protein FtsW